MICFTNKGIEVYDGSYTFDDIYLESLRLNNNIVSKQGDISSSYIIKGNLYIGNGSDNTILFGSNISITLLGEELQIRTNGTLHLGEVKKFSKHSYNGVKLDCPNIKDYGFGSNDIRNGISNSGNLFIYGSIININAKWSFNNYYKNQRVEILDSNVIGYGLISGEESILDNVVFSSHGRYGILIPYKEIKRYKVSSKKSIKTLLNSCALYFNPICDIKITNSSFDGYDESLCYIDDNVSKEERTLILEDCEFLKGTKMTFKNSKNTTVIIRDTYTLRFDINKKIKATILNQYYEEIYNCILDKNELKLKFVKEIHTEDKVEEFKKYIIKIEDLEYIIHLDSNTTNEKIINFVTPKENSMNEKSKNEILNEINKLKNLYLSSLAMID